MIMFIMLSDFDCELVIFIKLFLKRKWVGKSFRIFFLLRSKLISFDKVYLLIVIFSKEEYCVFIVYEI